MSVRRLPGVGGVAAEERDLQPSHHSPWAMGTSWSSPPELSAKKEGGATDVVGLAGQRSRNRAW